MIFVTVGTHEQQFNRLIKQVDDLKRRGIIQEDVFIQTGYSTYEPKYCQSRKLISYSEMEEKINEARIVITHGGPASFIAPLQIGKIPVVVPRRYEFGEHVNNHQLDFCNEVDKRKGNIVVVSQIDDLGDIIERYEDIVKKKKSDSMSNNIKFVRDLRKLINDMFET